MFKNPGGEVYLAHMGYQFSEISLKILTFRALLFSKLIQQ
ncbi:hypothetical protein A33Q_2519 [Indibacter alkaliphilus LW1]|uniref:Uncharacterized protein n=1 Tax=Indibacter alkaliphilus (strain CCUG 57479 / KCTC 22604 / LW1) TaxID=1189612 RepID=S2DV01_INDAL|nr:hypothetical protein A33Q_2519 [Indibacter alkaliphilus LW1]